MIDLYTFPTPNGWKVSIMLEELGLPYNTHIVHIGKDEQFKPEFLKISPNNKIPAIVDSEGPGGKPIAVFESAAILVYLAQKTKSPLLPSDPRGFTIVMEWLFFQMASVGPMFGQMGHFVKFAKEKVPYGIQRYTDESKRILGVMDRQLAANAYLAGADYSIADIACHGWIIAASRTIEGGLEAWPHVKAWHEKVGTRPAVQRGLTVPTLPPS
ncbi:MAG: glutathione S-transferase N-terminal domain-containing protein [Rhodospirillaceae bacterium]|nr:glutathione S-transferase N-terminal domain-containing protein [Rhodospirillaceae bacterium]